MKSFLKELWSYLLIIIITIVGTKLLTTYIAQPLEVEGASMYETLEDKEKLWLLRLADIERFDVIVFPAPNNPENLYVKRVIGVPGDTIAVQDNQLILNGQPMSEPYLEDMISSYPGGFTTDFNLNEPVPEGKLFVMGDNRQNSVDGRSFGFINIEDVEGEADGVFWPLDHLRTLDKWELSEDGTAIVPR
ncbi:signal peptidase I [Aerococcaceae bacterium DSM 111020]|nr:signal peptidase I [Aerococcaceae bacterium DSM 111020]